MICLQPLRTKGWDKALLEFTVEMLVGSVPESNPPLPERLAEITCPGSYARCHKCFDK